MNKSILTFGLLASTLVMLMIMPFLNQSNSFLLNSAMAQEYDTDHYENYPIGDMVTNEYESYRDNYNHEADPNYYYDYPSSHNEDYKSYPSDDTYDKSYDKSNRISSITKNNCINVNNINSGSSSSGELVKAAAAAGIEEEENSSGRSYDDGYNNKKGSAFDCIITNIYNFGTGEEEEGNGVGAKFCNLESLEGCFEEHLDQFRLEALKQAFEAGIEFSTYIYGPDLIQQRVTFSSFEDVCLILNTIPTNGGEFNASVYEILLELTLGLSPNTDEFQDLWDCILDAEPIF